MVTEHIQTRARRRNPAGSGETAPDPRADADAADPAGGQGEPEPAAQRAEARLRASEARLRLFIENAPAAIAMFDRDMRYVAASRRWMNDFHLSGDVTGRSHYEVFPEIPERWKEVHRRTLAGEVLSCDGERFERLDGTVQWVKWESLPWRDPSGDIGGIMLATEDITAHKQAEDALREAALRKDEFLATLAHELRNPLAPLRSGLAVLQRAPPGEAAERAREVMERQVAHLVRLVDDLLDVSRINRGKIELRKDRIDLRDAVRQALEASGPLVAAAGHALAVRMPERPLWIDGDLIRLVQVVANLVNNAVKYTPAGGRLAVEASARGGEAVVSVSDDGLGIPADMLPRVFDLFTQINRTLDRAQGGLGIGLSLVKRLVEMHGGSVTAESQGPGRGSTFTVRLPLAEVADRPEEPEARPSPAASGRRVLVVDDNVDGAELLSLLLELSGHQTRVAHSGPEALDVARGFRPEVVLCDIGMPGMDGYEVARRLRADPELSPAVLVAVTGWGGEGDKARSRAAGFDVHLTKPVDPAVVDEVIARYAPAEGRR